MDNEEIWKIAPKRVDIIGVPISAVSLRSCLLFVSEHFDKLRGEYICASNVHTTVMAHEDDVYLQAQSQSVLSIPDGKPLSVIGKKKGFPDMAKVTGTHFMQSTFTDPLFSGKRHYFYGTTQETLAQVIAAVSRDYPQLIVCGHEPSVFRPLSDEEVYALSQRIDAAEADFVWVALGAPRQELLMHRMKGRVNALMVGVGGAFNILAGIVPDAPLWMQNAGLEWLYRLCKEPRRLFKRYLVTNSKFIYYLMKELIWKKRQS